MVVAIGLHIYYNAFSVTGTIYVQYFYFGNLANVKVRNQTIKIALYVNLYTMVGV